MDTIATIAAGVEKVRHLPEVEASHAQITAHLAHDAACLA
jgi:hypothetical protein